MKKNGIIGIVVAVVIVGIVSVVGVMLANNKSQSGSSSQAVSTTNTVEIKSYKYDPTPITVKVGTKVTWTNQDEVGHTVTADDSSSDKFESKLLKKGETYSYTFTKAGTFTYHCLPHPYMKGTVTVLN